MAFCLLLLVVARRCSRAALHVADRPTSASIATHVLAARVDVRGAGYSPEERQALYRRLVERARRPCPASSRRVCRPTARSSGRSGSAASASRATRRAGRAAAHQRGNRDRAVLPDRRPAACSRAALSVPRTASPGSHNTIINATMAQRFFPAAERDRQAVGLRRPDRQGRAGHRRRRRGRPLRRRRTAPPNMAYHLAESRPTTSWATSRCGPRASPGALAQTVRETLDADRAAAADRRDRAARRIASPAASRRTGWSRG